MIGHHVGSFAQTVWRSGEVVQRILESAEKQQTACVRLGVGQRLCVVNDRLGVVGVNQVLLMLHRLLVFSVATVLVVAESRRLLPNMAGGEEVFHFNAAVAAQA